MSHRQTSSKSSFRVTCRPCLLLLPLALATIAADGIAGVLPAFAQSSSIGGTKVQTIQSGQTAQMPSAVQTLQAKQTDSPSQQARISPVSAAVQTNRRNQANQSPQQAQTFQRVQPPQTTHRESSLRETVVQKGDVTVYTPKATVTVIGPEAPSPSVTSAGGSIQEGAGTPSSGPSLMESGTIHPEPASDGMRHDRPSSVITGGPSSLSSSSSSSSSWTERKPSLERIVALADQADGIPLSIGEGNAPDIARIRHRIDSLRAMENEGTRNVHGLPLGEQVDAHLRMARSCGRFAGEAATLAIAAPQLNHRSGTSDDQRSVDDAWRSQTTLLREDWLVREAAHLRTCVLLGRVLDLDGQPRKSRGRSLSTSRKTKSVGDRQHTGTASRDRGSPFPSPSSAAKDVSAAQPESASSNAEECARMLSGTEREMAASGILSGEDAGHPLPDDASSLARRRIGEFSPCVSQAAGRVHDEFPDVVLLTMETDGRGIVASATVQGEAGSEGLKACLGDAARMWVFPDLKDETLELPISLSIRSR